MSVNHPPSPCLGMLEGCASDSGVKYELKIAALIYLRSRKMNLNIQMYRNVAAAWPFDDLVLKIVGDNAVNVVLIQLKHGEKRGSFINIQAFSPKAKKGTHYEHGDYNLRKYFRLCARLQEIREGKGKPASDDEVFLTECTFARVCYVIYTNKVIKRQTSLKYLSRNFHESTSRLTPNTQEGVTDIVDELLTSNRFSRSFKFWDSDHEVWNQLENDPREQVYRDNFLSNLRVFADQLHVNELDQLVMKEIDEVCGKCLPTDISQSIFEKFFQEMQAWMSEPHGTCLTGRSGQLERALAAELRRRGREAVASGLLSFREEYCHALAHALTQAQDQAKNLHLFVHDIPPGLRAAKLVQVLDKNELFMNNWCYVNDRTLDVFPIHLIKAACMQCKIILLDVDLSSNHLLYTDIMKDISLQEHVYIIFDNNCDTVDNLESSIHLSDQWCLNQLSEDSQKALLQRKVIFQGEVVILEELQSSWPSMGTGISGSSLAALLLGQTVHIGTQLPPLDPLYVSRTVQHRCLLAWSVMKVHSHQDCFILKDFPDDTLRSLRSINSPWEERQPSWGCKISWDQVSSPNGSDCSQKTKWTEWKPGISRHTKLNTHWLTNKDGGIIWERTDGNSDILLKHLIKNSAHCKDTPICTHTNLSDFLDWSGRTVLLSDNAGMGKSTFVTHLAQHIKSTHKTRWVVVIKINDGNILEKLQNNSKNNMMDMLFQYAMSPTNGGDHMFKSFLIDCLYCSGNVDVFIDGVDEVCPAYKKIVFQVLNLLRITLGRIWVASRCVLEDDLIRILQSGPPLSLRPFTAENQQQFLLGSWSQSLADTCPWKRAYILKCFVNRIRGTSISNGSSLYDVPLYSRMLAESYTNQEIAQLLKTCDNVGTKFNRFNLYKRFLTKTLDRMWEKDGITEAIRCNLKITSYSFINVHKKIAAFQGFNDKELLNIYYDDLLSATCEVTSSSEMEIIARNGLISKLVDGKLTFLHYTIGEYLAGWWLSDHYESLQKLVENLYNKKYQEEIRYFFDASLATGCVLHEAALNFKTNGTVEDVIDEVFDIEEEDAGGRRALHYAAISGNALLIEKLLRSGANVNAVDKVLHWSPLRYADTVMNVTRSQAGQLEDASHLDVVELLLQAGGTYNDIPRILREKDLVYFTVRKDYLCTTREIMTKRVLMGGEKLNCWNYLHIAAAYDSRRVLKMLIKEGHNVNRKERGKVSATPLHMAAYSGFDHSCRILLENGADVNASNGISGTPLTLAVQNGNESTCRLLLKKGAKCNTFGMFKGTPLHYASKSGYGDIVDLLLKYGASVNALDDKGRSAAHVALECGQTGVYRVLTRHKSCINQSQKEIN